MFGSSFFFSLLYALMSGEGLVGCGIDFQEEPLVLRDVLN